MMAQPALKDPGDGHRAVLLNAEQIGYVELAAMGLEFLAELEDQVDAGSALDVAWDTDSATTRETAQELRAIAVGWKARGGLFAVTDPGAEVSQ